MSLSSHLHSSKRPSPVTWLRAYGSYLGCLTAKRRSPLSVRDPDRGTRLPGSASGACRPVPRFPRSPPLAPPAPPPVARHCSSASQLLWRSVTSRFRSSPATAPRLPDTDRRGGEAARPDTRSPGSLNTESLRTCQDFGDTPSNAELSQRAAVVIRLFESLVGRRLIGSGRLLGTKIRQHPYRE